MKFIWEEDDIEPGRRIQNSSKNGELIIGYRYDDSLSLQPAVMTVVSLDDGMEVFHAKTATVPTKATPGVTETITARAKVAEWLNTSRALPLTLGLR